MHLDIKLKRTAKPLIGFVHFTVYAAYTSAYNIGDPSAQ